MGRSCSKTAGVVHDDNVAAFEDEAMMNHEGVSSGDMSTSGVKMRKCDRYPAWPVSSI